MDEEPEYRPYARARLQDTPETAERFFSYGTNEYPHWRIGIEETVHRNTVLEFLKRAPLSRGRFEDGKAEARGRRREARLAGLAPEKETGRPAPGETCPTCGACAGDRDDAVTLTGTDIAEAQRTLDDLIDRHLAARGAGTDTAR